MTTPLIERFLKFVDVRDPRECWEWQGGMNIHGYGVMNVGGTNRQAHRVVYRTLVGVFPQELVLDHLCKNRKCCNPDHLEPVTIAENNRRGNGFAGAHAEKTHCPAGHPYDEANTYLWGKRQMRVCRTCHRERQRRYRAEKRAVSA